MTPMRSWLLTVSKKKKRTIVPFIVTLANAFFGLLSVLYALDNQFIVAAYCIGAAAILDGMDGKLARAFGSSSTLGMELDSLCDAISFCLAPAILLYSWKLSTIPFLGLIAVGLYLSAGLLRLAKFNLQSIENKRFFSGVPTTIAALWIIGLVTASHWLELSMWSFLLKPYNIILILAFISFLMISSVRFPSLKSRHYLTCSSIIIPVITTVAGLCALYFHVPFCISVMSTYIVSSLFYNLFVFFLRSN